MPRAAAKSSIASTSKNLSCNGNQNKFDEPANNINEANSSGGMEVKEEPPEMSEEQLSPSKIDLSQFKFEKKKPHIKIEYEKDSPEKEEGKGLWEPANWKEFLVNLRIMRANYDAPVDTMGCHMSMDRLASPEIYRYHCLISLMLSSQTKDQVTFAAMERLRERGLTVDNVLSMSDDELGKLIYPVGFWKTKVQYIKKTTQILKEQYKGDIPDSVDKLCKLRGVGPKMAHICMLVAWEKVTGIGVDTHVHRISNRIGWVKKTTSTPEDTRKALENWLPFDLWKEVNHLLVGFGQTICLPIGPMCHECLNKDICPSSGKGRKSPKKTPKKEVKTENSDDEYESKPMKKKVTPRKELNQNTNNNIKSEYLSAEAKPRKRKVTPKKKEKDDTIQEKNIKDEMDSKKSVRNRKVTPKKNLNEEDCEMINNIEIDKTKLSVTDELDAKKSPRKRKVTPKKEIKTGIQTEEDMNDFEMKNDNLNIQPKTQKKVTPNKAARNTKANDENINIAATRQNTNNGKEVKNQGATETNEKLNVNSKTLKRKSDVQSHLNVVVEDNADNNVKVKKSPAQKRSPRAKVNKSDTEVGTTEDVPKRVTRGTKK